MLQMPDFWGWRSCIIKMRARNRHFNPRDAGASFALDGRYGFNQSDNSLVSTWNDRTNNNLNATEDNVTFRPTYRTSIQGGQPIVRFALNNQVSGLNIITNNVITTVCLFNMSNLSQVYARVVTTSKNGVNDFDSATRLIPILRNNGGTNLSSWRNGALSNISTASLDRWNHYCSTFNGTNCVNRLNESISQTSTSTGNFDINQYRIGLGIGGTDSSFIGDIACVSIFNNDLNNSLRKRMQFANAFSFKTPCD